MIDIKCKHGKQLMYIKKGINEDNPSHTLDFNVAVSAWADLIDLPEQKWKNGCFITG